MPVAELKKGALTLAGFLDALRDEGKITEADCATALRSSQAAEHQGKHILEIVADFEFVDLQDNGRPLDVEQLTMALARQSGQPYYRIDPLKVTGGSLLSPQSDCGGHYGAEAGSCSVSSL